MPHTYTPCPQCGQPMQSTSRICLACRLVGMGGEDNPNYKGGFTAYQRKRRSIARYPEKQRARNLLTKAVRRGELKRQPCQWPGCGETKTEAHHTDYSKPLEVVWYCRPHHRMADKRGV